MGCTVTEIQYDRPLHAPNSKVWQNKQLTENHVAEEWKSISQNYLPQCDYLLKRSECATPVGAHAVAATNGRLMMAMLAQHVSHPGALGRDMGATGLVRGGEKAWCGRSARNSRKFERFMR